MLNALEWPNNIAGLAWLPWVIWGVERGLSLGGRPLLLAIAFSALQILAGAPEIILFTWVITGAVSAGMAWEAFRAANNTSGPRALRIVSRMLMLVAWVSALVAVQMLPFIDFLSVCDRSAMSVDGTSWAMPKSGLANLLLPLYGCYRAVIGVYFQQGQDWTSSYYPGAAALALTVAGFACVRQRRFWLLLLFVVASLLMAMGDPGPIYTFAKRVFPPLALMRFPVKFVVVAAFGIPLLGAFAVASLSQRGRLREDVQRLRWLQSLGLVGCVVVGAFFLAWSRPEAFAPSVNRFTHAAGRVFWIAAVVGLVWKSRASVEQGVSAAFARWLPACVVVVACLDGLTHVPEQNPGVETSAARPGLVRLSRKIEPWPAPGEGRVFVDKASHDVIYSRMLPDPTQDFVCHRLWLFGNANLLENLATFDGFFSLYLADSRELWAGLFFTPAGRLAQPLFDFLGVTHVSDSTNIFEWKSRPTRLPLVTGGQQPIALPRAAALASVLAPGFRPGEHVYLRPEDARLYEGAGRGGVRIGSVRIQPERITFHSDASRPAVAVVAQSFHKNWRARVNGTVVPVLRANIAFQAVPIPKGAADVVLEFVDPYYRCGMLLSLAALASWILSWLKAGRDGPKSASSVPVTVTQGPSGGIPTAGTDKLAG